MRCIDKNEQCLLKFISLAEQNPNREPDIIETILGLGIKLKFTNTNPVYQIIDELNYSHLIGK